MSSDSIYSFGGYEYDDYANSDIDDEYYMSDDDEDNPITYDYSDHSTVQVRDLMFPESNNLKEFLKDGLFSDVTVKVDDKTYQLHRIVLSLKSAYFQKLFDKNFIEHTQTEVELKTVEAPIFDCIVKFMYENDLLSSITSENMTKLLIALDYLQIELDLTWFNHYIQYCENISMAHVFELFDFLMVHSRYPWLLTALLKYFSKNLLKISQTEYFVAIPFEYLKKILLYSQGRGNEDEESKNITKICANWVCHDLANRSSHIIDLVNAVKYRYSKMFFLIDANLNIKCSECDNKQKYIEKKFEELLNYSVEFIPGTCADWLEMHCLDSLIAPKNYVDMKLQMLDLLNSGDFSDISLKVGGKSFPLHRVVLASKSSYFRKLFTENCAESEIELNETDPQTFSLMLKYIYSQEFEITSKEDIVSLMTTSELFDLNGMACSIESFILEKVAEVGNIFELFSFLRKGSHTKLLAHVEQFILNDWSKVTDMENFLNLPLDILKEIVSMSNLFAQEEADITKVCIKWIAHDVQSRLQYMPSIIPALCRSMAMKINDDVKMENVKKDLSCDKVVQHNLDRLLTSYNPIKTIKPDTSSYSNKNPYFMASHANELRFFTCNDLRSLNELEYLRLVLPNATSTVTSVCATVLDENLFVHFNDDYFYAQNLATKRCISLTGDKMKNCSWNSQLLNCNGSVFLGHNQDGKLLKYSAHLNRWLTVPDINPSSKSACIFASNGSTLYSISTDRRDGSYAVHSYDERNKFWRALSDLSDMNRYDYPISACFSNQNLFVAFSSFAKSFNFRNSKWATVYNSTSEEYKHFTSVKAHRNNIFFVDKTKIHSYNVSKKVWCKELICPESLKLQYLNIVHTIY